MLQAVQVSVISTGANAGGVACWFWVGIYVSVCRNDPGIQQGGSSGPMIERSRGKNEVVCLRAGTPTALTSLQLLKSLLHTEPPLFTSGREQSDHLLLYAPKHFKKKKNSSLVTCGLKRGRAEATGAQAGSGTPSNFSVSCEAPAPQGGALRERPAG